jgi:hypothetical protein
MINFDGPNRLITLDSTVTITGINYIYSRWLDWVQIGNNATFPPAFRQNGGDIIGGGVFTGIYFFMRNDFGWRMKPPEQDIIISIVGNFYPEDPFTPFILPTDGTFSTSIRLDSSSKTTLVNIDESLAIVNEGVKKASILVPHTTDL